MGLARFFHEDAGPYVEEYENGFVIGTADYLAPEQVVDSQVDIRADIYSLGGALYYLLVGKSPFQDGTSAQKLIWHQVRQPKPVQRIRGDIPDALAQVLERMMAKEPARRFQTPGEVAEALAPLVPQAPPPPSADEMPAPACTPSGRPSSHISSATAPTSPRACRVTEARPEPASGGGAVIGSYSIKRP
jgi:serine/threonine protein kinase